MPDVKIYAGNPFRSQPVPPVRSLQVVIVRQIFDLCARGVVSDALWLAAHARLAERRDYRMWNGMTSRTGLEGRFGAPELPAERVRPLSVYLRT